MANVALVTATVTWVKAMKDAFAEAHAPAGTGSNPRSLEDSSELATDSCSHSACLSCSCTCPRAQFESCSPAHSSVVSPLTVPSHCCRSLFFIRVNLMSALGILVLFGVVKRTHLANRSHEQSSCCGKPATRPSSRPTPIDFVPSS